MKNKISKYLTILLLSLAVGWPTELPAQCPMCKMSAESNLKNGGTDGKGLNAGILYMFAMPYLFVFGVGYWWYRNRKTEEEDAVEKLLTEVNEQE